MNQQAIWRNRQRTGLITQGSKDRSLLSLLNSLAFSAFSPMNPFLPIYEYAMQICPRIYLRSSIRFDSSAHERRGLNISSTLTLSVPSAVWRSWKARQALTNLEDGGSRPSIANLLFIFFFPVSTLTGYPSLLFMRTFFQG